MTHLISTGAAPTVTDPGRHRFVRLGAAAACVAALIAAGGYGATQTFGPDAYEAAPPIAAPPSDLALSQLHESLAAQYGAAAPAVTAPPSDQAVSQLHESLAAQYGAAASVATAPTDRVLSQLHDSVAGQYGGSAAVREPSDRQLRQIRDRLARVYGGR